MRVPQRLLTVDGRENGGVSFYGWDRNEILVRAMIRTRSETTAEAETLARTIDIDTSGDRIRANGPSQRRWSDWSVSYEVMVPRRIDLSATTQNGGISVEDVEGNTGQRPTRDRNGERRDARGLPDHRAGAHRTAHQHHVRHWRTSCPSRNDQWRRENPRALGRRIPCEHR